MNIHEYQAKELLQGFEVPVPRGGLAYSPEQAAYRAIVSAFGESAAEKVEVLKGAGVVIAPNPSEMGNAAATALARA
ncbi:MAG: ATP-grasp domain-containing protein [bacterium]